MSGGMYLAAAGALVQQLRLEVLSNNIANIDTVGYKGDQSVFHIPDDAEADVVEAPIEGIQTLSPYAPPFTCRIDFSQGAIRQTGNALDVALNGSGFFSIQAPTGVQYTRQGNFTLNREGVLVSQDGYPVLGEGGEISLEAGSVDIDLDGRLVQDGDEVGQLRITDFQDLTQLTKAGNGRFVAPDAAGRQARPEDTSVRQGCLEAANVIAIRAMTDMIETSRAFEAYQKIITTADEATANVIKDVGSVS